MLRESFVLLPSVARQGERNVWQQGIHDWNDFLSAKRIKGISPIAKRKHDKLLHVAKEQLLEGNTQFFSPLLLPVEHWRLYDQFRDDACFLDIETGMRGEVTVVGMSMRDRTFTLLRNSTLDKQTLQRLLSRAKILVTFNGRSFDMPVLEKYYNLNLSIPHIDLRHACASVGLTGGLKSIEKQVGIARPEELSVLHGAEAPKLWRAFHATGDKYYLDLLVGYNKEDCENLQALADNIIPKLWQQVRYS